MQSYKVYFLGQQDHILSATDIVAPDDEAALARAAQLCVDNPKCDSVEVWQLDRLLRRHNRVAA